MTISNNCIKCIQAVEKIHNHIQNTSEKKSIPVQLGKHFSFGSLRTFHARVLNPNMHPLNNQKVTIQTKGFTSVLKQIYVSFTRKKTTTKKH